MNIIKQNCENIFVMLMFDAGHITEKLWGCWTTLFISFKNMMTRRTSLKPGSGNVILYPKIGNLTTRECFS